MADLSLVLSGVPWGRSWPCAGVGDNWRGPVQINVMGLVGLTLIQSQAKVGKYLGTYVLSRYLIEHPTVSGWPELQTRRSTAALHGCMADRLGGNSDFKQVTRNEQPATIIISFVSWLFAAAFNSGF